MVQQPSEILKNLSIQFDKLANEFDRDLINAQNITDQLPKQALVRVIKKMLETPLRDDIKLEHELETRAFILANRIQELKIKMAIQSQMMNQQAMLEQQNLQKPEENKQEKENG